MPTSSPLATENASPCSVGPLCFPSRLCLEPTELAMLFAEAAGSPSLQHASFRCRPSFTSHATLLHDPTLLYDPITL